MLEPPIIGGFQRVATNEHVPFSYFPLTHAEFWTPSGTLHARSQYEAGMKRLDIDTNLKILECIEFISYVQTGTTTLPYKPYACYFEKRSLDWKNNTFNETRLDVNEIMRFRAFSGDKIVFKGKEYLLLKHAYTTPLIEAVIWKNLDAVKTLLKLGADVNLSLTYGGQTLSPIGIATAQGYKEILDILVSKKRELRIN